MTKKAIVGKTQTTATFLAPSCVKCSADMKPVFPRAINEDGTWSSMQPDNGLILQLSGGYGMYIDPMQKVPLFAMCGKCVDEVRATPGNEWFNTIVDESDGY